MNECSSLSPMEKSSAEVNFSLETLGELISRLEIKVKPISLPIMPKGNTGVGGTLPSTTKSPATEQLDSIYFKVQNLCSNLRNIIDNIES